MTLQFNEKDLTTDWIDERLDSKFATVRIKDFNEHSWVVSHDNHLFKVYITNFGSVILNVVWLAEVDKLIHGLDMIAMEDVVRALTDDINPHIEVIISGNTHHRMIMFNSNYDE